MKLMTRSALLGAIPSSLLCFSFNTQPSVTVDLKTDSVQPTTVYHDSPQGVDYSTNPSVFGRILQGQLPCRVLRESHDLLAFLDRTPRAPLHALVIPKRYIQSVFELESSDTQMVEEMQEMAISVLREYAPEAYETGDYRLAFHIPPFNSVDHLHVHVLAPASEMDYLFRYVKYAENTRWSVSLDRVLSRLKRGKSAVPY